MWVWFGGLVLVSIVSFQTLFVWIYIRRLKEAWRQQAGQQAETSDRFLPHVNVVLCLRGLDYALLDCLNGLARQNYPNFEVTFVFDSRQDAAYDFVSTEIQKPYWSESEISSRMVVLDSIRSRGSLKCQAIVAALDTETSADVFALVDADCAVDSAWLEDLVRPLRDPTIGASTGNRFFEPVDDEIGCHLRAIWNSAAIVQMQLYSIAWGGSIAIRADVVRKTGLPEVWQDLFCEDTILADVLKKQGFKLFRIPNLIVKNRGRIGLASATEWLTRQLINSRRYAGSWPLIFLHGNNLAIAGIVCIASVVLWGAGVRYGGLLFAISCCYQLLNYLLLQWINYWNRQLLKQRETKNVQSGPNDEKPIVISIRQVIAYFVSQFAQPIGVWRAQLASTVSWRGIKYKFVKDGAVEMFEYVPKNDMQMVE